MLARHYALALLLAGIACTPMLVGCASDEEPDPRVSHPDNSGYYFVVPNQHRERDEMHDRNNEDRQDRDQHDDREAGIYYV